MGGFPGMEDMMSGDGEEKRPPQMPPEKPPQMPKQTQDISYSNDWKTINGSKVHFKDGVVDKGPKDMIWQDGNRALVQKRPGPYGVVGYSDILSRNKYKRARQAPHGTFQRNGVNF